MTMTIDSHIAKKLRKTARTRVLGLLYGFMVQRPGNKWAPVRVALVRDNVEISEAKSEISALLPRCRWSVDREAEIRQATARLV